MQSKFEINVAKANGRNWNNTEVSYRHYFRAESGFWSAQECANITADLRQRFPEPQFKITVIRWECSGHEVSM